MVQPLVALALDSAFADFEPTTDGRRWVTLRVSASAGALPVSGSLLRALPGGLWVGRLTPQEIALLLAWPGLDDLEVAEPFRLERPALRRPAGSGVAAPPAPGEPVTGVRQPPQTATVLGIIDAGLPFAHPALCRDVAGRPSTRFAAVWDQDSKPEFGSRGIVPTPFGYGAVLDRQSMDACIAASVHASRVCEDEVYRMAGYGEVDRRRTHGAHTSGLLGAPARWLESGMGFDSAWSDEAIQADVLGVQLPRSVLDSPSRAAMGRAILDGLQWMRMVCGARTLRVAIPYGSQLGPHDGQSWFERGLDAMVAASAPNLQVFVAAGNSAGRQTHAQLSSDLGVGPHVLTWRQPGGSEAATWLELWAPVGVIEQVTLTPPGSGTAIVLSAVDGQVVAMPDASGRGKAHLACGWVAAGTASGLEQVSVLVRLAPTLVADSGRAQAPAGDWQIGVTLAAGAGPGVVHAYAGRARGSLGTARRGVQGQWLAGGRAGVGWSVTDAGSVNGMACGDEVHLVGAYVNRRVREQLPGDQAAPYASSGPGRQGGEVDLSLPGEQSLTLPGVRGIGTRAGMALRMNGSSVATAQAARFGPLDQAPSKQPWDARLGIIRMP